MNSTTGKSDRLLQIYSRLVNGEVLSKKEMADKFHITERSVQRDVEALRCFFQEQGLNQNVIHDRKAGGYRLQREEKPLLNNGEILAVCKILLESRSMRREEMFPILRKLTASCVPQKSRAAVDSLISNEKFHYIEPHHGKFIIPRPLGHRAGRTESLCHGDRVRAHESPQPRKTDHRAGWDPVLGVLFLSGGIPAEYRPGKGIHQ